MVQGQVLGVVPLGFPWQTLDPFLFCVHHLDAYPNGDEHMAPARTLLAGRQIGMDFSGRDGWSMYHGRQVPGFPQHPHRGFETITIARQGFIDHTDSMGAAARFGQGDVQWMTAGKGVVHSEMFPLINQDSPNTTELFQIWLNLPSEDKRRDAHFKMFWRESVPVIERVDAQGRAVVVTLIAGELEGDRPLSPPPASWASRESADVAIWTLRLAPGAQWTVPAARSADSNRIFYLLSGQGVTIGGRALSPMHAAQVRSDGPVTLVNGESWSELLMLQGRPIGEPVVQQGPFVMNSAAEIRQAMVDYHRTGFGGWPWYDAAPVHPREEGRFALHADGHRERPPA